MNANTVNICEDTREGLAKASSNITDKKVRARRALACSPSPTQIVGSMKSERRLVVCESSIC